MLSIRKHVYRDRSGFLICGRNERGNLVSIFTETRTSAEHIRDKMQKGEALDVPDFHYGDDNA